MLTTAFGLAEPYVVALWAYLQYVWEKLQPYHPEEMFPALAGFVLVFFGGNFFTLCAAVEAYRLVGFEDTKRAVGSWWTRTRRHVPRPPRTTSWTRTGTPSPTSSRSRGSSRGALGRPVAGKRVDAISSRRARRGQHRLDGGRRDAARQIRTVRHAGPHRRRDRAQPLSTHLAGSCRLHDRAGIEGYKKWMRHLPVMVKRAVFSQRVTLTGRCR